MTERQRLVPRHDIPAYEARGWEVVDPPEPYPFAYSALMRGTGEPPDDAVTE